jgi:REP element-mobilizing transposase RayT
LPQPETQGLPQQLVQQGKSSISDIVGAYKSIVANGCLEIYKSRDEIMGKFWQRNYYEHIIRNDLAYYNISEYIINNPLKWEEDRFYMK